MSDITDAGPRLKAMNDALEENARLTALVESLRREVREQRKEIAGLREERRALLDADRPMPDRPEAIAGGDIDRPQPIAKRECDRSQPIECTPEPHATPGEGSVQGE